MEPYDSFDEFHLVNAFQTQGDDKAFEEIYKRFWFKLYSWAFTQTSLRQESEEMVQIVFERLWKNRNKSQIRNIGAYLAVSLKNVLLDFHRKEAMAKKFMESQTTPLSNNTTEEDVNRKILLNELENTLRELPSKTQTVFRMSRYENKSVHEIADHLHLTEKAVEYHITKALKLLRHRFKGYFLFFF